MSSERCIGRLPTGEAIHAYRLANRRGMKMTCITYGGIITRWLAPGRDGRQADIVLGCDDLAGYLGPHPYVGAIVAR